MLFLKALNGDPLDRAGERPGEVPEVVRGMTNAPANDEGKTRRQQNALVSSLRPCRGIRYFRGRMRFPATLRSVKRYSRNESHLSGAVVMSVEATSPTQPPAPETPEAAPQSKPAWEPLSVIERRIIGVLVEKQRTSRSDDPLTLNALITGSNQKTNRDPILDLSEAEVDETLKGSGAADW